MKMNDYKTALDAHAIAEVTDDERKRVESKLKESEIRYRRLFERSKDGILILDAETGQIEDVNPFLIEMLGYTHDEFLGRKLWEMGVFKDIADSQSAFRDLQRHEFTRDEDLLLEASDGRRICVEFISTVYVVDDKKIIQCSIRDITKRRHVEEKLRESRAILDAALASMTDAVFVSDAEGRFIEFNDAFATVNRFKSKAECAKTLSEFHAILEVSTLQGQVLEMEQWPTRRALRGESGINIEFAVRRKDTGQSWIAAYSFAPIRNDKGNIVGCVGVGRDVTEPKRAEQALLASQARFRTMVDAMSQLAWIADPNGVITWYNKRWYDFTGTTAEEMDGWGWQSVHDPKTLPFVVKKWNGAIETGEVFEMEFPLRGADGHFRQFLTRAVPLRDATGKVINWFGTNTDVDALTRAENEIRRLNSDLEQRVTDRTAQLETANKELEAFSYSVSHDLRAPLRAVNGFSRAVVDDYGSLLPDDGKELLQIIQDSAQQMGHLIDDLLTFSRLSRTPLKKSPVNMSSILRQTLDQYHSEIEGRKVQVILVELPPCEGDSALLRQVWVNLVSNAFKYTAKQEKTVIEIGFLMESEKTVYFIRDNGAGFDMRYAGNLFGVFQRLHRSEDYEGTGVGLAIVQRIISRHGGRIWAEAEIDRGATFFFTL